MTIQQIKSFIAVVESGSFNRTEETSFYTKQALKKHVDSLEVELDFKLLSRTSKGIQLTPAGKMFYDAALKSIAELELLIQNCRAAAREDTHLRIGNPDHPRLLLENAIDEYAARYPDIQLDIVFARYQLAQKILDNQLDIAECIYRPEVMISGISYRKLCTLPYNCILASTHPLACRTELYPEDLNGNMVGISKRGNARLCKYFAENYPGITLRDVEEQTMPSIMTICFNHGIFIAKAYYTNQLEAPLISIPLRSEVESECGVIYRTDSVTPHMATPVSDFLNILDEFFPLCS